MRIANRLVPLFLGIPALAQLAPDQRASDMRRLADTVVKEYAFPEWKLKLGFDAFNLKPWLERAAAAPNDLDFYDVLIDYIASLNDAHSAFFVPSSFSASLGFSSDFYDDKLLIDSIDRTRLPEADFAFAIGDELVSVDGKPAVDLAKSFEKYAVAANPVSTRRAAAAVLSTRFQSDMPRAHKIGDSAEIVIRRANGDTATLTLPWRKSGFPLEQLPKHPVLKTAAPRALIALPGSTLAKMRNWSLTRAAQVVGVGRRAPVFAFPTDTYTPRLGTLTADPFFAGVFAHDGLRIGYIRIHTFSSFNTARFASEVAFMTDSTDGLILDITRNPGGSPCLAETLLRSVMNAPFQTVLQELVVSWGLLAELEDELAFFREIGLDSEIPYYEMYLNATRKAFDEGRTRTEPLPICQTQTELSPRVAPDGFVLAYTKPILLATDEFSASAAEFFAAVFQDNNRGRVFGARTMGAGGAVSSFSATTYTEGGVSLTIGQGIRRNPVAADGYPEAPLWENIGVRPTVEANYMTAENLALNGKPYVDKMLAAAAEHIKASR